MTTMSSEEHWENVYRQKEATEVSWYRAHLEKSLALIASCELPRAAHIVDIGGGASTLVDDLLDTGYTKLTVIDLAEAALEQARARLGGRAAKVTWLAGNATSPLLDPSSVSLWHDRAVFHFLTDEKERRAYVEQVARCVEHGGYVLIGTFAEDGPERCSGLPVARYSPREIASVLGADFESVSEDREVHRTPWGSEQKFSYALCRRLHPGP